MVNSAQPDEGGWCIPSALHSTITSKAKQTLLLFLLYPILLCGMDKCTPKRVQSFKQELEIPAIVRENIQIITLPVCFSADRNWGRWCRRVGGRGFFLLCMRDSGYSVICLCISPKVSLPVHELWVPLKREVQIRSVLHFFDALVHHVYCTLVCETVLDVDEKHIKQFLNY